MNNKLYICTCSITSACFRVGKKWKDGNDSSKSRLKTFVRTLSSQEHPNFAPNLKKTSLCQLIKMP